MSEHVTFISSKDWGCKPMHMRSIINGDSKVSVYRVKNKRRDVINWCLDLGLVFGLDYWIPDDVNIILIKNEADRLACKLKFNLQESLSDFSRHV